VSADTDGLIAQARAREALKRIEYLGEDGTVLGIETARSIARAALAAGSGE
jgi:hypothetical protein